MNWPLVGVGILFVVFILWFVTAARKEADRINDMKRR